MGRERNPMSIDAERLYHEGMEPAEIAAHLSVPGSTVRRWKSYQKWDGNAKKTKGKKAANQTERSDKKRANLNRALGINLLRQKAMPTPPELPTAPHFYVIQFFS